MTLPGVDRFVAECPPRLGKARLGAIVHPASVTSRLEPTPRALLRNGFALRALFGPQHGTRGEKQDNMVESDHYVDAATGLPVHSLYGEVRKPTPEMLDGVDALLFDLQDVGTRVYTFVWTMALAMEACGEAGKTFVTLDRPNPIGGTLREGPVVEPGYESFVGLHPLPLRHGLTCGEVATWLVATGRVECDLEVVRCVGLERNAVWPETELPWVMPSPNLPTPDSCLVYPGTVLVEGTNLSEGRGTTRPFELIGAPFLDGEALAHRLASAGLPGARFRSCHFEPTFNKHVGELCGGVQIHVTDEREFRPVRTAVEILAAAKTLAPEDFAWRRPPYEYEETLMPIDILWGSDELRTALDEGGEAEAPAAERPREEDAFQREAEPCLLYR